jgi:hypothetical protein
MGIMSTNDDKRGYSMGTQIRVSSATHRALARMSKATDTPVTKIVARLVKHEVASKASKEEQTGTDAQASPAPTATAPPN